jgi:hypothetical protein
MLKVTKRNKEEVVLNKMKNIKEITKQKLKNKQIKKID